MKTIAFSLITLFLFTSACFAQSNCSKYYPLSEGANSQLSLFDGDEKNVGTVQYLITDITPTDTGKTATMTMNMVDKNGNALSSNQYDLRCHNGVVSIDFKSFMRPGMLNRFEGMDMESDISGTNLDLPNELFVGQTLPNAGMTVTIKSGGMKIMEMKTEITNRKVIAEETLTTPAGTFVCLVITQTMKMSKGGYTSNTKQWISEGVGIVKNEDYNKKGKLMGRSLLTSFSK